MRLLIIGDLHLSNSLRYADYIPDRRNEEFERILKTLSEVGSTCDSVVFLGDLLQSKNPSIYTVEKLLSIIEIFSDLDIFFLAGNHEKGSDGKTALDFLNEIKGKKWTVVSDSIVSTNGLVFCPYFQKTEFGTNNLKKAADKFNEEICLNKQGEFLFVHHAIMGIKYPELPDDFYSSELYVTKKTANLFKKVFCGHIHTPFEQDNVICAGSIFNNEVGECNKYFYVLDIKPNNGYTVEKYNVPTMPIRKVVLSKIEDLNDATVGGFAKVYLQSIFTPDELSKIRESLSSKYINYLLINNFKKNKHSSETTDLIISTESLLELYAQKNKIDKEPFLSAFRELNL